MKSVMINVLFFVALLFTAPVMATDTGESWHTDLPPASVMNTYIQDYYASGAAAGQASAQCHFYQETKRTQGCVGMGFYSQSSAVTFGMGKKFSDDGLLFNFTIGAELDNRDDTHIYGGAGINWQFRE